MREFYPPNRLAGGCFRPLSHVSAPYPTRPLGAFDLPDRPVPGWWDPKGQRRCRRRVGVTYGAFAGSTATARGRPPRSSARSADVARRRRMRPVTRPVGIEMSIHTVRTSISRPTCPPRRSSSSGSSSSSSSDRKCPRRKRGGGVRRVSRRGTFAVREPYLPHRLAGGCLRSHRHVSGAISREVVPG